MIDPNLQVSWNLSESLILQISNLLQNATNNFINGKIGNAFTSMQAIRLIINQDLISSEIKDLDKKEKEAALMINYNQVYRGFAVDGNKQTYFFKGREKYLAYHHAIMAALKLHGYSIPSRPDSKRLN